ncbi:MYO1 [Candida theae]|uniref:MYO1 n=1 Tax=Candida theae TaxID=1198502 RepID=A0AAD5FYB5_9ASCO|nr:MYO1 [Candida theae]KAI5957802.1 MYO1 [Candida theae]
MSTKSDGDSTLKNWVWVPNDKDLFTKGYITDYLGNGRCAVSVVSLDNTNHVESNVEIDQSKLENCNPEKFNKCEDMAELTHLNEPSVVYNLYLRYMDDLIYTYSGLFLVAINPYKSLPIYDDSMVRKFRNQPTDKESPHIFAIAEATYRNLLSNKRDQSILVTGESGAGKTENTKKIIQYLSSISTASSNDDNTSKTDHIDDKILQANPILESFGNAKTIKNNNSSRFGKFIQIYFDSAGDLAGANIDYYLLEKSRVVHQAEEERNYHIFYHFIKGYEGLSSLGLNKDVSTYEYLNKGVTSIPNVDDFKEFNLLVEAFKTVGFSSQEMQFIFQILAIILHLGNLQFTSWKAEQASFTKDSPIDKIAELLTVDVSKLKESLLKPKVKAGREFVTKSKKAAEVKFAIDALAKYLYEKLFQLIIKKINLNLNSDEFSSGDLNIGVLDIAGFEIFDSNSFEQLCINYTNEKLQQFFNHHSFILEQSEYLRENIQWEFIDFGKDLQPTIDLIEKRTPMGILKLLDEECMMPKSSDKMFMDKLSANFAGKNKKFSENKFKNGFIVQHYAGKVEYNVENWLQKNKDPVSDGILQLLLSESKNKALRELMSDETSYNQQSQASPSKTSNGPKMMQTVSQKHKNQLKDLMDRLETTEPHFVRCILPNLDKKARKFDRNLVLSQLRCNGVLEGIRITRAGYPNKLTFDEFFHRYSIIGDNFQMTKNTKTNCELILKESGLSQDTFKIGLTKIFFKNGILGKLETKRDITLKGILTDLQRRIRGNMTRVNIRQQIKELQSSRIIAKTMNQVYEAKTNNPWMTLFYQMKPLLEESVQVMDMAEVQNNLKEVTVKLKDSEKLNKGLENDNVKLRDSLKTLEDEIMANNDIIKQKDHQLQTLHTESKNSKKKIEELETTIRELKESNRVLTNDSKKLSNRLKELHNDFEARSKELASRQTEHSSAQSELTKLRVQLEKVESERLKHVSKLDEMESKHERQTSTWERKIKELQSEVERLQSEASNHESKVRDLTAKASTHEKLVSAEGKYQQEIAALKSTISELEKRYAEQREEIKSMKSQMSKDELKKSKYEEKIEEAKEKVSVLKSRVESKSSEIDRLQKEVDSLKLQLSTTKRDLESSKQTEMTLSQIKSKEESSLREIEMMQSKLSESTTNHKQLSNDYEELKFELQKAQKARDEYSSMVSEMNGKLQRLEQDYKSIESEKENQPPNRQIMEEFTHMKLKLNEQNAALRKEKFENKKLIEELGLIKERIMNGSLTSSDITPKRRSLAIGERVTGSVEALNKEINNLKFRLQQEQSNYQRAENYAIELQKKLNKVQSSRGLNSSTDYEKKFKDSQGRVAHLEKQIEGIISNDSTSAESSPSNDWTVSRSESFGGQLAFKGVSADFIQMYQDINKTLRSTRDELGTSKAEILRLKALLRESEDELYQVKHEKFKSSMKNFEEEIAHLKVKHDNVSIRNQELIHGLELYKKRSDEYFKKLELAESAVTISKHQEESARREVNELRSQLRLAKEEARTSQIMLKDCNSKIESLEQTISGNARVMDDNKIQIKQLEEKLAYHVKNYENRETTEQLKEELRNLHKDLNFKTQTETTLVKENKKLQLDLEEAVLVRNNIQKEMEEMSLQEEELEQKIINLTNSSRQLENDKILNERKIASYSKQITGLKELVSEVTQEKERLIDERERLQDELFKVNLNLENQTVALDQSKSEVAFLKNHLENQRQDAEAVRSELSQSKMSSTSDYRDQQKIRNDLLVSNEENYSLKKANEELNRKVHKLEEKLYSNDQIKYLESRADSLQKALDSSLQKQHDSDKTIKSLERKIKSLETRVEHESQLSKRYNDENFDYQNKINHYKVAVDSLDHENIEKDLQLKNMEEQNNQLKESMLMLQKENLELRERLSMS